MVFDGKLCICIIGGGAAGLSTLKILLESDKYKAGLWDLVLFEAREQLGGVWLPSSSNGDYSASPLYDSLITNLPHPLMAFPSHWYPPGTPLYPHASVVLRYLQDYAKKFDLLKFVEFNTRVEEALWNNQLWEVRLSSGITCKFDRIVVANGHHNVPYYPSIPGLHDWVRSGKASHAICYRNAQPYQNMRVLVIGGGPSGQDIAAEVSQVAMTVYHSVHTAAFENLGIMKRNNIERRGKVVQLDESSIALFEDGSTAMIDFVIIATGYLLSFPFLPQLRRESMPRIPPIPLHVLNSNHSVFPLARHIFPLQDDFPGETIAFVGLLIRSSPFPLFEAQGRLIREVFSNLSYLDQVKEMNLVKARYDQLRDRWGDDPTIIAKKWHVFEPSEQFSYRVDILELANVGAEWHPGDWEEEIYREKVPLRSAWIQLENNGKAGEWVAHVGEGGRHEWVSMMRRLLDTAQVSN